MKSLWLAVKICIWLYSILFLCSCAGNKPKANMKAVEQSDYALLIDFYQEHISPVDGDRCSMYPGCSSYSAQAIDEYGIPKGALMTFDRLIRCGRDGRVYLSTWINGAELHLDEVKKNNEKLP